MKIKWYGKIGSLIAASVCVAVLYRIPVWVVSHGFSYLLAHGILARQIGRLNELQLLSPLLSIAADMAVLLCTAAVPVLCGILVQAGKLCPADTERSGMRLVDIGGCGLQRSLDIKRICLTGCMGAGAALVVVFLLSLLPETAQAGYGTAMGSLPDNYSAWFFLLFAVAHVILAPAAEEFLFRGVLYGIVRSSWGNFSCILIVSCLFAGIHGNSVQMVYAFLMGVILCVIREVYGSVFYTVSFHLMFNLVGSGLLLSEIPAGLVYSGCIFFIVTIILFVLDIRRGCLSEYVRKR